MIIEIKVIPNAKKQKIIKQTNYNYKVYIVSVNENGKANRELIDFLSDYFKVSKSRISIKKGKTTRKKTIQII